MKTNEFNKKRKTTVSKSSNRKSLQILGRKLAKKKGIAFRTKKELDSWILLTVPDKTRKRQSFASKEKIKTSERKLKEIMKRTKKKRPVLKRKQQLTFKDYEHPMMSESALIRFIKKGEYEDDIFFEGMGEKIISKRGWISPDGRFFDIRRQTHEETGNFLAKQLFDVDDYGILEMAGWMKLSGGIVVAVKPFERRRQLTNKHRDMIYDYMIENDRETIEMHLITKNVDGSYTREYETFNRKDLYSIEFSLAKKYEKIEKINAGKKPFYIMQDRITSSNGWIAPDGTFFEIGEFRHESVGEFLAWELYEDAHAGALEERGWIKFSDGDIKQWTREGGVGTRWKRKKPTEEQINLIYDNMVKHNDEIIVVKKVTQDEIGDISWKRDKVKRKDLYEYFRQDFSIKSDWYYKFSRKIDAKNGLLSPDGKFYECGFGEHTRFGAELAKKLFDEDNLEDLEKRGWVELSGKTIKKLERIGISDYPKLTTIQQDMIMDFIYENGLQYGSFEKIITTRDGRFITSERDHIPRKELYDFMQNFATKNKKEDE